MSKPRATCHRAPSSAARIRTWTSFPVGLLVLALLGAPRLAHAAEQDVVVLRDGTRLRGRVLSAPPSGDILIAVDDREKRVVPRGDIQSIELRMSPPADPRPAASPAPTDGDAEPPARKPTKKRSAPRAADERDDEPDCDEDDDECESTTEETHRSGLGVSYSRESARARKGRRNTAVNFALSLSGQFGFGSSMTLYGAESAISVRMLVGSEFPGRGGGSWFGAYFEPSVGGGYVGTTLKVPRQCVAVPNSGPVCGGGGNISSSAGTFLGTFGAGVQWMHFGAMVQKTKKQSGFGLGLGGVVGYQETYAQGQGSGSVTYGPQLSLIFPSYNAGTASFSAVQVNVFVLPTKDFVMLLGGLQVSFG